MSHYTEIHKNQDTDNETILGIGKTDSDKFYIDIRHYHRGDVIDTGNIAVSRAEWDLINTNLNREERKFFICPECGDIMTEDDILEDLTTGGYGMCMCLFGNGQRTLVRYEPYINEVLKPAITPNEIELIKIIRSYEGLI